jgi:hypothetical protein
MPSPPKLLKKGKKRAPRKKRAPKKKRVLNLKRKRSARIERRPEPSKLSLENPET